MYFNSPLRCLADGLVLKIISIHQCTNSRSIRLSCWSLDIPKTRRKSTSRSRNKSCPSSYSRLLQLIYQSIAIESDLLLTQGHLNCRTSTLSSLIFRIRCWMSERLSVIYSNSKKSTTSGLRPRRKSKLIATSNHVTS